MYFLIFSLLFIFPTCPADAYVETTRSMSNLKHRYSPLYRITRRAFCDKCVHTMAVISDSGVLRLPQPETRELGTQSMFMKLLFMQNLKPYLAIAFFYTENLITRFANILWRLHPLAVKFAEKAYVACLEALDTLVTEFSELETQLMKGTEVYVEEHDGSTGSKRMGTLVKVVSALRKDPTVNRKWQVKMHESGQLETFSQSELTPLRGPLVRILNPRA